MQKMKNGQQQQLSTSPPDQSRITSPKKRTWESSCECARVQPSTDAIHRQYIPLLIVDSSIDPELKSATAWHDHRSHKHKPENTPSMPLKLPCLRTLFEPTTSRNGLRYFSWQCCTLYTIYIFSHIVRTNVDTSTVELVDETSIPQENFSQKEKQHATCNKHIDETLGGKKKQAIF